MTQNPTRKYSLNQRLYIAARKTRTVERFIREVERDSEDANFRANVDALLFKIYMAYKDDRSKLTMTEACRYIPLSNHKSQVKHIKEAQRRNLVTLVRDEHDKRKVLLNPSSLLIEEIESRLEEEINEVRNTAGRIAHLQPFPKDNLPLAQYTGD